MRSGNRIPLFLTCALSAILLTACGGGGAIGDIIGGEESKAPIKIDDRFDDWGKVAVLGTDGSNGTNDPNGVDWELFKATNDDDFLYLYFESHDNFRYSGSATYTIYLDLDGDDSTDAWIFGDTLYRSGLQERSIPTGPSNLGNLIDRVEIAVPLVLLDDVVKNARSVRITAMSMEGRDAIPGGGSIDGFMNYVMK